MAKYNSGAIRKAIFFYFTLISSLQLLLFHFVVVLQKFQPLWVRSQHFIMTITLGETKRIPAVIDFDSQFTSTIGWNFYL